MPYFESNENDKSHDEESFTSPIQLWDDPQRGTRASQDFWTYIYTMDQIKFFSYKNGTTITLYDEMGGIRWHDTLDKGEYGLALNLIDGVYEARGSEKFSTMTLSHDDPLVGGFYAKDENGFGLSHELYTYVPSVFSGNEKFIIFSYEDNTVVNLSYIDGTPIWSGILNDGEHYADSSLNDAYLHVAADRPVSALSYYDQGYEVPSKDKSFTGTEFYTFAGKVGNWTNDVNVFAFEDNTEVWIKRTNDSTVIWNGILNYGEIHTESFSATEEYLTIESTKDVAVTVFPTESYEGYYCMSHFPDDTGYGIGNNFIATTLSDLWSPGYMYITAFEDNTTVNVSFDSYDKPSLDSDDTYFLTNASDFVQANKGWGLNLITSDKKISVMSGYETAHASFVPLQFGLEYPDLIPENVSVDGDLYSSPVLVNPGQDISISACAKNNESSILTTFFPMIFYNDTSGSSPFYSNMIMPLGGFESSPPQVSTWTTPQASGIYYINISVDPHDVIIETSEQNNIFTLEIWVRGMPDSPTFYNKVKEGTEDILLYWVPPATPFTHHYLIYRSESQTGFDFSDVWIDTSLDSDSGIIPLRITWNDTNAASPGAPKEYYYCIRTVSHFGDLSMTSNTVGKWTRYFEGPVKDGALDYTRVAEYSEMLGTVTGFTNMQDWEDGGASADLVEEGVLGFKTADVITNGAFTDGNYGYVVGWRETESMGSGSTRFDNSSNALGGAGGSLLGKTRAGPTIPDGFTGTRTQTIKETIPASSYGNLSFWWRKEYSDNAPTSSTLQINLVKPDDSSVTLWQNNGAIWNAWTYESVPLAASTFDQTGTYKIDLSWTFFNMMTSLGNVSGWFDEIELNLTMPQTYYQMDMNFNVTGIPINEGNDLEIYGCTSGEAFDVQVFNGSAWNIRLVISDIYPRLYRYQLNPFDEIINGNVYTRYFDVESHELVQDILTIDYLRVTSYNGGTSTFSLPLEPFIINSVDWYTDQIPKAISIKWSHDTGYWYEHHTTDEFGINDADVEIGKGYEIYSGECYFTFCGSPAANIRFLENQLHAPANFSVVVDQNTGFATLSWDHVGSADLDRYLIYKTSSRMGLRDSAISEYDYTISNIWTDPIPILTGESWYYAISAVNASTTVGYNSTYSIGSMRISWDMDYDTFGLPCKPFSINSIDLYCNIIPNVWGINYYNVPGQRWMWHKTIMPKGAYDPDIVMAEGYQISTNDLSEYSFVGI
ncbi:MAG: hypothetical protein JSV09_14750 [Thermoplasmata archaeon]|nr:MAG: hypothetical protein JSV09_14750 [Thermoplasmata archaeon]